MFQPRNLSSCWLQYGNLIVSILISIGLYNHVDGTSRVQTVSKHDNPHYYKLIKEFYKKTGCPMLLNTSLNIKGKPIVNSEEDGVEHRKEIWSKGYG